MQFLTLRSRSFRNLHHEGIAFSPTINLLIGDNGQGKTNILEALYVLAGFRSFRLAKNRDVILTGAPSAELAGEVFVNHIERTVNVAIQPGSKTYHVDGKTPALLSDWVGKMVVVTFSPDDLGLVKGEPETRRRWLDRIIFLIEPKHLTQVVAYHRALKARNTLLRDGLFGRDLMLLDSFDETLAKIGAEVSRARAQWVQSLSKIVQHSLHEITAIPHDLPLQYETDVEGKSWQEILDTLVKKRTEDIQRRSTSWGVHRDDLKLVFSGREARRYASQGEQRALTLALKLGETELLRQQRNVQPVLLLDDVAGELDGTRHALLFHFLQQGGGQVFIAGTDIPKDVSMSSDGHIFAVKNGQIHRRN